MQLIGPYFYAESVFTTCSKLTGMQSLLYTGVETVESAGAVSSAAGHCCMSSVRSECCLVLPALPVSLAAPGGGHGRAAQRRAEGASADKGLHRVRLDEMRGAIVVPPFFIFISSHEGSTG